MSDLHPRVQGEVRPETLFAAIGEAPGPVEEREGKPFWGPSGEVLANGAGAAGFTRTGMSILNVSEFLVDDEEADVHIARMGRDVQRLQEEILSLKNARHILLIGADAVEAVLGLCGPQRDPENPKRKLTPSIMDYHGSTFNRAEVLALQDWAEGQGIKTVRGLPPSVHSVSITLHPAFALRGKPRFKLAVLTTIGRAAMMSRQAVGPYRPTEDMFILAPSAQEADDFLRLRDPAPGACDIETKGHTKAIDIVGIGSTKKILVCPWVAGYPEVIRAWFERPGFIIGHNFPFDLVRLAGYDIYPKGKKILDTMAACARLQPVDDEVREFPWLSLATCSARHDPGFWMWKESDRTCTQALYKAAFPWCDPALYDRLYNGIDVWRTANLWERAQPALLAEGML